MGKKKTSSFASVDHGVVDRCTINVMDVFLDQIQKKTLDDLKESCTVDTSQVVDVEMLETNTTLPTQVGDPSSTPSTSTIVPSSDVGASTFTADVVFHPSLTQAMLFIMGYLA
ncbi:hypothetical protein MTR67_044205 [Solanum verrucosum]|uniref:Uncharacterized protein n=1 Tax=Solanum verrucosum TaxID=315347 RepID=A0AAF0URS6_SOLVR|nr:hypothetical protein MTR67_044205 [Solanum verrucosum]